MGQAESPLIGQGMDPYTSNVVSEPVPVYLSVMLRKLIAVDELKYSYSAYFQVVTSWRDPRVNDTLGVWKVVDQLSPDLVAGAMSGCKPNVTFAGYNISQKEDCLGGLSQTGLPQLKDCKKPCTPVGTRCCDGVWLPSLNIPNVIFFPQDRYSTESIYFFGDINNDMSAVDREVVVEGEFSSPFNFQRFPFDSQDLRFTVTVESGSIYLVSSNSGRQQEQASKGLSGGGGGGFSTDEVTGWKIDRVGLNCSAASSNTAVSDLATYAKVPSAACYIDDVLIYSKSEEEHAEHLRATLDAIAAAGLTCHPEKCKIASRAIGYLGFEVQGGKMGIQEAKVAVLDKLRAPKGKGALRALLGFLNYYRRFIPNFSKRAHRLNQLLREGQAWKWGPEEEQARRDLLEAIKAGTVLQLLKRDAPFTLYTDWSSMGMGAVLCQEVEGEERVVAYANRSCIATEANYSSYEGEGLAAVWGVTHFRAYLQGQRFTLITDHQPLLWLMTNRSLTGRNARWAMRLQEYDFLIKHRAGKTLQHADGLGEEAEDPWAQVSSNGAPEDPSKPTTCVFVITISRTSPVYVLSVILPVMLSVYLTFSVFFAKPEDLELRSATCVTLFLALAAVQFVIDSQLPRTSSITQFGYLVITSYIFIMLATIESVVVFWLAERIEKDVVKEVSKRFGSHRPALPATATAHDAYNTLSVELMKAQPPPGAAAARGEEGGSEASAEEREELRAKQAEMGDGAGVGAGPAEAHETPGRKKCGGIWPWGCLQHIGYRYKPRTEGHEDEVNYKLAVTIDAVCAFVFFTVYTIVCIVLYAR
ncbi:hypothetical protein CLOP_g22986 [Closterium sp. NIES-67]|nr:hypothetical protein CLOP_g22986 [Closterium sp. NIES-67]